MMIARYTLELHNANAPSDVPDREKRVLADMPAVLEEVEENVNDLLPNGYSIKIEEKR